MVIAVKPEFLDISKYEEPLILRVGQSAAIEVPFKACPQPKVTWKCDGHSLPESRRFKVDTIYNMTSMIIARAEKPDAGTYTLVLENGFGKATFSVPVIVLGKF